jgi:hypothetical protein
MAVLAFLMISNVSYPAVPTVGFRKLSEILGTLVVAATVLGVLLLRKEFYFPALVLYVLYGVGKTVFFGLLDRRPTDDSPVISDQGYAPDADVHRSQRRRRRHRPSQGDGGSFPPEAGGSA